MVKYVLYFQQAFRRVGETTLELISNQQAYQISCISPLIFLDLNSSSFLNKKHRQ